VAPDAAAAHKVAAPLEAPAAVLKQLPLAPLPQLPGPGAAGCGAESSQSSIDRPAVDDVAHCSW
jgi:hypothetical protein